MRRKAIKDYLLSKYKPGASSKEFFDAVGPFMNNKCRLQGNIILKEDDQIITDTTWIRIFVNKWELWGTIHLLIY